MKPITIIDCIMGKGKTQYAINMIKNNMDQSYIYITPYLDEIKRVKKETGLTEPSYKETTKKQAFHKLLVQGKSLCSTHALFVKADDTTRQLLKANDYVLILDEVMDVVSELSDFTSKDLQILFDLGLVHVKDNILIWDETKETTKYDDFSEGTFGYADIKILCNNKNLVFINDKVIYWNFPADIFECFREVFILTYEFRYQVQRYYYDWYGIDYRYYQIEDKGLIEYEEEKRKEDLQGIVKFLGIYEGKYNNIGKDRYSLTHNWYERELKSEGKEGLEILKRNLYNWFNNQNRGTDSRENLWTTFKMAKQFLKGKGYTKGFIPINTRATNDYIHTSVLAYTCNRYINPNIKIFFNERGISFDEDMWGVTEILQWIWRSRIRKQQHVNLYLPSKRMRTLLGDYITKQ